LLSIAGLASGCCFGFGIASWRAAGGVEAHSILHECFCAFLALSLIAFLVYFVLPRAGVTAAWLIVTGAFISSYLLRLQLCVQHACTTQDSLHVGWDTLTHLRIIWLLAAVAVCLLLDHTAPIHPASSSETSAAE
jgi:hypothetical protein